MNDNILSDFVAFIEKSAQLMNAAPPPDAGESTMGGTNVQNPAISAGQGTPRQSDTDVVNNTMSAGVSNPSHGGAGGMPKPVTTPGKPLEKAKF